MKKITCALLSIFLITPCMANIHINPDVVVEVIAKHFSSKQIDCIREYNAQVKASNGTGIAASKLWNVCVAGGLNIKQSADKEKCRTFVNELTRRGTVKFYEVCDKHKNMIANGTGRCIDNVFSDGIKVTQMIAAGLAKEYARVKYADNDLTCRKTIRQSLLDDYIQCTSMSKNMAYEFKFDSVTSTTDYVIDEGTESGICKMYDVKYTPFGSVSATYLGNGQKVGDYESWPAACETTDASKCSKINETMQKFGRTAKIGSTGSKGNKRNACIIDKDAISPSDLRTAFGIDNYIFKKSGIQLNATTGVRTQVCAYVSQNVKNPAITSCVCNDGYVHLYDFSSGTTEKDDVLTCTINNKTVDFVFDDLSEAWETYDKSGREAMNCLTWGGTFTGKKCMGLNEKMCNVVRDANAQSCPECKKIQWNKKDNVCELPESVSAINLKRGLTYSAIIGGAALSVVITVGTLGTATAPTSLVLTGLTVETLGAGIELKAQIDIDRTADKFFTQSANCNDARCAENIILEYLKTMSNQQNDMQEAELSAADAELARLADLIPAESDFYQRMFGNGTDLASNETGEWTSAQIWRAVGIGLQSISVLTGVGKWVIKKSPALQKGLQRTTIAFGKKGKILRNARKVALANVVDYDKLDDVGKEWYKLWQEYAPNNQTFDEFKAMTNGNLDEMKQMTKTWTPRSKRLIITAQIDKQLDDITVEVQRRFSTLDNLMDKYNIDAIPADPDELAQLYKQHPDLEQAVKTLDYARAQELKLQEAKVNYNNTNYSTYDPRMTKAFKDMQVKEQELTDWWYSELDKRYQKFLDNGGTGEFSQSDEYRQMVTEYRAKHKEAQKATPTQWQLGEDFQLKNLANVVDERVKIMDDIVASNPEIQSKLTKQAWKNLSEKERLGVAQQILDEYAAKLGTPKAEVLIDRATEAGGYYTPGTNRISLNPKAQFNSPDRLPEILSHEYGHLVDYMSPNTGAMGEQYAHYAAKIYDDQEKTGYRIALTEQSSYAIGNATGRTAEKTLDQAAAAGLGTVGRVTIEIGVMDQLTNNKRKAND